VALPTSPLATIFTPPTRFFMPPRGTPTPYARLNRPKRRQENLDVFASNLCWLVGFYIEKCKFWGWFYIEKCNFCLHKYIEKCKFCGKKKIYCETFGMVTVFYYLCRINNKKQPK
jgi:hypothetical protein